MKILFPRNIEKWFLSWLTFTRGPVTISIIQLLILAVGGALMLAIFNNLVRQWFSKATWLIFSSPALLVAAIIAFFKISELTLIPFIAKMVRTHFLDATKKFQVNFSRPHVIDILIKKVQYREQTQEIKYKNAPASDVLLDKMRHDGLL